MACFTERPAPGTLFCHPAWSGLGWFGEVISYPKQLDDDVVRVRWFDDGMEGFGYWCFFEPTTEGELVAAFLS